MPYQIILITPDGNNFISAPQKGETAEQASFAFQQEMAKPNSCLRFPTQSGGGFLVVGPDLLRNCVINFVEIGE